jgi:LCP family protein required for cell wall assembly
MDNFRNFKAPRRAPGAMDGFRPSRQANTIRPQGLRQPRTGAAGQARLDDFKTQSRNGFRPNTQPTLSTTAQRTTPPPSQPRQQMSAPALPRVDMKMPTQPGKKRFFGKNKKNKKQRPKWQRIAIRVCIVLLILAVLIGGYLLGKGFLKVRNVFKGGGSAPALASEVDISKLKGEGDGRVNVLLMGIGGKGHDGADLTDTMILASIDPVNNKAALMSVPRDLWVKMPNNYFASSQKINAAYSSSKYKYIGKTDTTNANRQAITAGFEGVDKTVEEVLGVPVHYNVLVTFRAFEQAIDTVGGVSVNVPEALVDPTMAWENNRNPVLAKAGVQQMKGKQALMYVRSRATSSDFARSERQRAVMVALKDKVFTLGTLSNPVKISNLISAFGDNIQTDISVNDATRMADIFKKIPNDQIVSASLTDTKSNLVTTSTISGLSVVVPKAGLYDYSAIQSYTRNLLKDGYLQNESANVAVYNGSGTTGLATTKANELRSYGYTIVNVGNASANNYDKTVIVDLTNGAKKYTKHYLEQRFKVTAVTTVPDSKITTTGSDFVIILGKDAGASQ